MGDWFQNLVDEVTISTGRTAYHTWGAGVKVRCPRCGGSVRDESAGWGAHQRGNRIVGRRRRRRGVLRVLRWELRPQRVGLELQPVGIR